MKALIIALSLFFAANTVTFAQEKKDSSKAEPKKSTFTCSHHPDVMSSSPGKCSKCGMKLVETSTLKHNSAVKGSQSTGKKVYVCPMDKEVTSNKKGNCPKCGMPMVKKQSNDVEKHHKEIEKDHKEMEKEYKVK